MDVRPDEAHLVLAQELLELRHDAVAERPIHVHQTVDGGLADVGARSATRRPERR